MPGGAAPAQPNPRSAWIRHQPAQPCVVGADRLTCYPLLSPASFPRPARSSDHRPPAPSDVGLMSMRHRDARQDEAQARRARQAPCRAGRFACRSPRRRRIVPTPRLGLPAHPDAAAGSVSSPSEPSRTQAQPHARAGSHLDHPVRTSLWPSSRTIVRSEPTLGRPRPAGKAEPHDRAGTEVADARRRFPESQPHAHAGR